VLLIDTFEQCQPLEAWLRESFLPRLADHAVVVVAGRVAPDAEWSLDPGWAQLFIALAVRPLDTAQSDALLAARGVPAEQRGAFVAFAGGSPLALSLAASVPAATPGALWEPAGDVLTTLVERLVGGLPSAVHRRALEVVAQAYVTREPLLRAVLGDEDTDTVFSWLRQLPYIEASPEGLHPHDAVRATLEADLRWRDPERYDDIRVRISLAGLRAVRGAAADDALLRSRSGCSSSATRADRAISTITGRTNILRTLCFGPRTCPACCAWPRKPKARNRRPLSRTGCTVSRRHSASTATRAPAHPCRSWPSSGWTHHCPRTVPRTR
jgi:hypothetical protein